MFSTLGCLPGCRSEQLLVTAASWERGQAWPGAGAKAAESQASSTRRFTQVVGNLTGPLPDGRLYRLGRTPSIRNPRYCAA
jgi:hypothetical protein